MVWLFFSFGMIALVTVAIMLYGAWLTGWKPPGFQIGLPHREPAVQLRPLAQPVRVCRLHVELLVLGLASFPCSHRDQDMRGFLRHDLQHRALADDLDRHTAIMREEKAPSCDGPGLSEWWPPQTGG